MKIHSSDSDRFASAQPQASDHPAEYRIRPRSVVRNSLLLFGTQIATKLLGLISSILLANYLGADHFGLYNYAFAFTALFIPLTDLGADTLLMREVARGSEAAIISFSHIALAGKTMLTVLDFALVVIVGGASESFHSTSFVFILLAGAVTFLRTYWTTFSSIFRALNRVAIDARIYTATRIAEFGAIVSAIVLHRDILFLLCAMGAVNVVAIALAFVVLSRNFFTLKPFLPAREIRQFVRAGLPFALTTIFTAVYFNLDTVLVKKFIGDSAAGIYRAAYNLILPMMMVTASVTAAVFPYVSQNFRGRLSEVARIVRESATYLLMLAMPGAVLGALFSSDLIAFLFHREYLPASESFTILVWFLPIVYITNLYGSVLGAMDDQPFVLKVTSINVVFNVVANLILIPRYAQNGAAVVTVLTEALGLVLLVGRMRRYPGFMPELTRLAKIGAACVIAVPAALLRQEVAAGIAIPIAIVLYSGSLFLLRAVSVGELRELVRIVGKKNGAAL